MAHDLHATLRRTPLHGVHAALGARLVPFAGFEMPVHYPTGITEEHRAVRTRCGLFDVSHMGEFEVTGPGAVDFVNFVTTNDVAKLAIGQVHYSTILNDRGTIEDDCLVYRFEDRILMVGFQPHYVHTGVQGAVHVKVKLISNEERFRRPDPHGGESVLEDYSARFSPSDVHGDDD